MSRFRKGKVLQPSFYSKSKYATVREFKTLETWKFSYGARGNFKLSARTKIKLFELRKIQVPRKEFKIVA